jgi:hypothetical protein
MSGLDESRHYRAGQIGAAATLSKIAQAGTWSVAPLTSVRAGRASALPLAMSRTDEGIADSSSCGYADSRSRCALVAPGVRAVVADLWSDLIRLAPWSRFRTRSYRRAFGAASCPASTVSMCMCSKRFETPDRRAVLLLHGFPEIAYSWRKVLPVLAPGGLPRFRSRPERLWSNNGLGLR